MVPNTDYTVKWIQEATKQELKRHAARMHVITHVQHFRELAMKADEALATGRVLTREQVHEENLRVLADRGEMVSG